MRRGKIMKYVKNLKDLRDSDFNLVGGKASSLSKMIQANIVVPPGFVIFSSTFESILEKLHIREEINNILKGIEPKKISSIERASQLIVDLIMNISIPDKVCKEISNHFEELDNCFVAIRSSATMEDSKLTSWAGGLDSFLNVTKDILIEKIKQCWASLYSTKALHYAYLKGIDINQNKIAVIVQKMVQGEVAGVAFSVHPVNQNDNQIIIEAGFGLGEIVVSGEITPDKYIVSKKRNIILEKIINIQTKKIVGSNLNDNKYKVINNPENQKLSDEGIIMLSKIITEIENHFGFPVDVEWAEVNNQFYIIQSRPITTLLNGEDEEANLLNYIKSEKWFLGIRADESLLFYSAKQQGCNKYIERKHGITFAESLLVTLSSNYPIRVFNLWQAKLFHAVSKEKIENNPLILLDYINENEKIYKSINNYCNKLIEAIKNNQTVESKKLFIKIFNMYEKVSAHFIIIFSLGLKLAENKDNIKNADELIKKHDEWRNSEVFREEAMGESIFYLFNYLLDEKNMKIEPLLLMKFLTLNEIKAWFDNQLTDSDILNIIKLRKKQGFVYINITRFKREIIDNVQDIYAIRKFFLNIESDSKRIKNIDEITGQITYDSKKKISGIVVVIKDKYELEKKKNLIKGKILVAIQTSPHFIPYMKNVKAIVTDEGGLTCHAAIISRELKKTCIVGTKVATKYLKDGDIITIDIDNEMIRKEKKYE